MSKTRAQSRIKSAPVVVVASKIDPPAPAPAKNPRPVIETASTTVKPLPTSLADRYELVKSRVQAAARRSGRTERDILVVAVTKNALPEQVREILALGHRDLGENRVQHLIQQSAMVDEFQSRLRTVPSMRRIVLPSGSLLDSGKAKAQPDSSDTPVRWHMIGHLQRNKAKKVIDLVRLTHSVDSLRIAEELQNIALKKDRVIEVLIQVNCSGEDQKFGCPIPAAIPLAEQIGTMINVKVRGLMTMAAHSDNPEDSRATFGRCRELFEELRSSGVVEGPVNILSMGMTGDFEVAIEEGANCVRIGSALFGEAPAGGLDGEEEPDED